MFNARREENFREAIGLLEQAVARDPSFLLAYCRLARAHDALYFNGFDRTATRLASAAAAVQAALRLAPDSGEAHFALATHLFRGYYDFDHAREELAIARKLLPNDPAVFALAGLMDHHQTRHEDAVRNLERALELDPRDIDFLQLLAVVYNWLRRFPEMEATLDRALAVAPADPLTRVERGLVDDCIRRLNRLSWKIRKELKASAGTGVCLLSVSGIRPRSSDSTKVTLRMALLKGWEHG